MKKQSRLSDWMLAGALLLIIVLWMAWTRFSLNESFDSEEEKRKKRLGLA